ncbi:hypothetical protein LCGC14_0970750 [marine sediment metagenome]|uniref:Uncharacterized protein n=1 Tax=marine sediment metagenome TaxID=412755 RepID=A0A0F9RI59_9ZZZZ
MIGKLNVKIYGCYAQLFVGTHYVGSIPYDNRKANVKPDGWTEHVFYQNGNVTATIDARGG